ncbi:glycoside hydrolase family 43 protein [Neobacillus sp. DY30]|uniref:glycoside hydrolase family 43 protein n=1 Tax=Neobacillus sp. DY30 TaxID=3047871 RepID=UPI0024BF7FD3|nr:glycoside hydrolase family 43 protein [Neobacillus sp. DY30]WHY02619.1 glycoside hydrolase family 43 protein [Neobacillus sp. DY30]
MYKKLLALTAASSMLLNFVPSNGSIASAQQNESTLDYMMASTNPATKTIKAVLDDVPEVIGAPNIELEVQVKLDELAKGKYTSLNASFNIPDSLTVTGVEFNSKNIIGASSYTYSKDNLKLHVKGGNVSFAHKGSDLFAKIKLKVKDFVTSDQTDVIRTNSIQAESSDGEDIVYSVDKAVAYIGLKQLDTGAIAKIPGYANSLMSHKFGADPHAMVYDGRVYIYMTNDEFEYDANGNLKDNSYSKINTVNVISSDDMMNWTDHGAIPVAGPNGAAKWATQSWAVSVEHKEIDGKDKFFLYFSNNASGIGVLTSDSPIGPWTDPLGKPLIGRNDPAAQGVTWLFDPAGFVDDDGQAFLYYGGGVPGNPPTQEQAEHPATARVIKLSDDMIHTVGEPQVIDAPFLFEASGMHKKNGKYYYSYSTNFSGVRQGDDPGTGEIAYMTSDSPMGPWTYEGTALRNPWVFFGVGGNNHQDFFEFKGESYITYHAQTVAKAMNQAKGYRSPHINKVEYDENGKIKDVKADMKGVSQVANLDPYKRNEAETIGWNAGIKTEKSQAPGSMVESINLNVTDINNGDWVAVSQADFGKNGAASFEANIASTVGGEIEIRVDSPVGEVIGALEVTPTGGDQGWRLMKTEVKKVSGIHNIFFIFKGEGENNLFNMDYWKFTERD